jgi:hypothetical protein
LKAPIAQRGKAKQKRAGLRLVGLGLVVTRDGGIPLTWHAYPGDRPDLTQFPHMIGQLVTQYEAVCNAAGIPASAPDMTVVFDAGQNSADNFAHLARTGLHYIGSVPASDCPDLTSLPASVRQVVDRQRFGGLTAFGTRRETRISSVADTRSSSAPTTSRPRRPDAPVTITLTRTSASRTQNRWTV